MVGIMIAPPILGKILNRHLKGIPQELCRVINGDQNKPFHTYETVTPMVDVAVRQIINCPYEGDIRRIYLESKAMELIAIKLAGNNQSELPEFSKSADEKKIRQARDILIEDLENTPSLQELAKSVGLTHTRLNRGFRKIYGITVFNYLRAHRLKYARMLLQKEDMNVAEVAYTSGFSSPSHFATDFFRCYGVQPKLYRKQIF
jgi:AraC-like DNA-binding protein